MPAKGLSIDKRGNSPFMSTYQKFSDEMCYTLDIWQVDGGKKEMNQKKMPEG